MIDAQGLTKSYRGKRAVDGLSFVVRGGLVTGFLGPNGAGKSTAMRLMLSLDRGGGRTTFNGKRLVDLPNPSRVVGACLDAKAFHPQRTARNHLRMLAAPAGISRRRVDEVLELVGLDSVADKRPGGFSLGMGQRLGLAAAVLGDPDALLLDEPANGLDPQGINWLREFLKTYAAAGRTVFVSSHLLAEMAQMADQLVVIGQGRLLAEAATADFISRSAHTSVIVRSPNAAKLAKQLTRAGSTVVTEPDGALAIVGSTQSEVGELAAKHSVVLHELMTRTASLEQAFLEATADSLDFVAQEAGGAGSA